MSACAMVNRANRRPGEGAIRIYAGAVLHG